MIGVSGQFDREAMIRDLWRNQFSSMEDRARQGETAKPSTQPQAGSWVGEY